MTTTTQKIAAQFEAARNRIETGETKNVRRDDPAFAGYFARLDYHKLPFIEKLKVAVNFTPVNEAGIDALIKDIAHIAYLHDLTSSELAEAFDELQKQDAFNAFIRNPVYSPVDLLIFSTAHLDLVRNPRSQKVKDYLASRK